MQPIHLVIGIVEGLATVAVVSFVYKARPDILTATLEVRPVANHQVRNVLIAFLAAAIITGGILSWFASKNPDGLEWAIARVIAGEGVKGPLQGVHGQLAALQAATSLLPEYDFRKTSPGKTARPAAEKQPAEGSTSGTSVSGIVGGFITLGVAFLVGLALKRRAGTA